MAGGKFGGVAVVAAAVTKIKELAEDLLGLQRA
jgi:hypothetical protein